jgi:hypothetical protein
MFPPAHIRPTGSSLSSATRLSAPTAALRSNTIIAATGLHWVAPADLSVPGNRPRLRIPRGQQLEPEPGLLVGNRQCRRMDDWHQPVDVQDLPDGGAVTGLAGRRVRLGVPGRSDPHFRVCRHARIFTRRKVSAIPSGRCATAHRPARPADVLLLAQGLLQVR